MDIIDTSGRSIFLGSCVLIIMAMIFKTNYEQIAMFLVVNNYIGQDSYFEIKMVSLMILISIGVTFCSLALYKNYLIYSGSKVYLGEPFD